MTLRSAACNAAEPLMDDFGAVLKRERAMTALLPLFFVSGATSLVYQTLWARQLQLVFGTSSFAVSTVLAAFMGGLALGGLWMSARADKVARPLAAYGALEAGIGLYALAFPWIVRALEPVYLGFWRGFEPSPVVFGLVQLVLVGSALVLPTALMGATLPLLARFATDRLGSAGDRVGRLYAVNTLGAVFGTWLCGFVLLPLWGLPLTTGATAAANLLLGLAAWGVDGWTSGAASVPIQADLPPSRTPPAERVVALALALAGFASLADEVAWFRLLTLMLGPSVYAFSVMLLAFLVGIALGGAVGGGVADAVREKRGPLAVLALLAGIEVGVAVLSVGAMYLYPELPFWYVWIFDALGAQSQSHALWVVQMLLSGLIMTPPAVLMGAAFPVAVRAVVEDSEALGGPVGRLYAANTVGSVLGAVGAGFFLLPGIGLQGTLFVAACANLLAATVLLVWSARQGAGQALRLGAIPVVAVLLAWFAARPPWNPLLMTAGMYHYVDSFKNHSREGIIGYAIESYELLYYREGLTSVVTVARNRTSENRWLANNGKVDASTTTDMPTQVLCALLPAWFAESPKDAVVIGLASGVTAGAVASLDSLERIDVVEIEPAIVEASDFFLAWNGDVLRDPRTRFYANDGRNHLLLMPEGTYDLVVSEPSNPWISGVSNLFTEDFFRMGKARLKPGGVWGQWVQLYGMGRDDLRSLLATFASVYPHVLLFSTIEDADLVLVGSDRPIRPDPALAARFMVDEPRAATLLGKVEVNNPSELASTFYMDRDGILAFAGDIGLNTDANMRIEYGAPLNLYRRTALKNFDALRQHQQVPYDVLDGRPQVAMDLAHAWHRRGELARGVLALAAAAQSMPEGSAEAEQARELARRWYAESQGE